MNTGLIPLKFIRIYQVRNIESFLPKEYNMEKWFVKQMQKEGHLENRGLGYWSVTEKTQKQIEAFLESLKKMDRKAEERWSI